MVRSGLEQLLRDSPDLLRGRRFGLVTNATGVDSRFRSNVRLLVDRAPGKLVALFAPEHGFAAAHQDGVSIEDDRIAGTNIPIFSLYGEHRRPTEEMLRGIDLLIYDIQDVGARFYTFLTTLTYLLEAAAERGCPLWVLDRPNPLGGTKVEGPILDPRFRSFVGPAPMPIRYGLTPGELARWFRQEASLEVELRVFAMSGWRRRMWYDETGLPWIAPSPNMPTLDTATVYPGMCLFEGTNVSEGRGTTRPFEWIGAPWIDADRLAGRANDLGLPGVFFRPIHFIPWGSKYAGEMCHGVQVHVLDRASFAPVATAVGLLAVLRRAYPETFRWIRSRGGWRVDYLAGTDTLRMSIDEGLSWEAIVQPWDRPAQAFHAHCREWFLYE